MTTKYFIDLPGKRNSLGRPQIKILERRPNDVENIMCLVFGKTIPEAEKVAKKIVTIYNNQTVTKEEIENRLMDIFSRVEVKQDIRDCREYIMSLINS